MITSLRSLHDDGKLRAHDALTWIEQGREGDATQVAHAREGTPLGQQIHKRQNGAELPTSLRGSFVPWLKHHESMMSSTRISRLINALAHL
jgi:hypothetical protein